MIFSWNKHDKKRLERPHLCVLGMPAWDHTKPFHALAIVAGIARQAGFSVDIHDVNIEFYLHVDDHEKQYWSEEYNDLWASEESTKRLWNKYEKWLTGYIDNALSKRQPHMVAFSVNLAVRGFAVEAAKYIKKKNPAIPVMFGGVDCFPAEQFTKFLNKHGGYCDILCQGEAEIAFEKYLKGFAQTGDWRTKIPGFSYYQNAKLVNTGEPELPTLREKLPQPAYDLFDLSKYTQKGALPFYLSRGCIYKCHFCSERSNFKFFRCRLAEEALEELKFALSFATMYSEDPTFTLADSNFNANFDEFKKFVDLIIKEHLKLSWGGQAHFDPRMTTEFIQELANAGLKSIFWGFESASQHVIDLMNKRYKHSDALRIINDCIDNGITQHLPIIIGFPGETPSDIVETIEFILCYRDKPFCQIHLPCQVLVRPNSPLHKNYKEFGLKNTRYYDWTTEDGTNSLWTRIARRFILRQAHSNSRLSIDTLVDTEEIKNVDMNETNVATDVFLVVKELFSRSGNLTVFENLLLEWASQTTRRLNYNRKAADLSLWMELDKNSATGRDRLYNIIMAALLASQASVTNDHKL